ARGTCFPETVSLKNTAEGLSAVGCSAEVPLGWTPCSRQKSSQHALPICTPAWP
ncbi:hypothetical protein N339_13062, partial [Pterocles gutturalis]